MAESHLFRREASRTGAVLRGAGSARRRPATAARPTMSRRSSRSRSPSQKAPATRAAGRSAPSGGGAGAPDLLSAAFKIWSLPFIVTTLVQAAATGVISTWSGVLDYQDFSATTVCLFALVCTAWAFPHPRLMVAAHVLSSALKLADMPRVWDGTWWFVLWSVPFVCVLLTRRVVDKSERTAAAREIVAALRPMCHVLYTGAAIWKLNADFLDPSHSCAPIFGAQLLGRLPEVFGLDNHLLAPWLIRAFLDHGGAGAGRTGAGGDAGTAVSDRARAGTAFRHRNHPDAKQRW